MKRCLEEKKIGIGQSNETTNLEQSKILARERTAYSFEGLCSLNVWLTLLVIPARPDSGAGRTKRRKQASDITTASICWKNQDSRNAKVSCGVVTHNPAQPKVRQRCIYARGMKEMLRKG